MRKFHEAGLRLVANLKPCLLDDHPRFREAEAARRLRQGRRRRARDLAILGRRGRAHRFHQPRGRRLVAPRARRTGARLRDRRRLERQQRICVRERRRRLRRVRRADAARSRPARAAAVDDARFARGAAPPCAERAALQRHPRGRARHSALRADLERRQPDELALAEVEPAHGAADVDVRPVQHRPRHRRLLGAGARSRTAGALDAGRPAASALPHEFLEARRRLYFALAASRGDALRSAKPSDCDIA